MPTRLIHSRSLQTRQGRAARIDSGAPGWLHSTPRVRPRVPRGGRGAGGAHTHHKPGPATCHAPGTGLGGSSRHPPHSKEGLAEPRVQEGAETTSPAPSHLTPQRAAAPRALPSPEGAASPHRRPLESPPGPRRPLRAAQQAHRQPAQRAGPRAGCTSPHGPGGDDCRSAGAGPTRTYLAGGAPRGPQPRQVAGTRSQSFPRPALGGRELQQLLRRGATTPSGAAGRLHLLPGAPGTARGGRPGGGVRAGSVPLAH